MRIDFLTELVTTPVIGKTGWVRTVEPFELWSERLGGVVQIPAGFEFDKDSVPRLPVVYLLFKERLPKPAAAVHDWLYATQPADVPRRVADLVMNDVAVRCGMERRWKYPVYLGVRMGGWVAWRRSQNALVSS